MGIRIHKTLGYGLKYVKFKDDPRINKEFWNEDQEDKNWYPELLALAEKLKQEYKDKEARVPAQLLLFHNWLEGKETGTKPEQLLTSDFVQYSGYATEMRHAPLVFGNFKRNKDWHRYDDIIDYYQGVVGANKDMRDSVDIIRDTYGKDSGIYPNTSYCNRQTGKAINITPIERQIIGEELKTQPNAGSTEFREYTPIQWQRNVVPKVPIDIELFCKCANVFKDTTTIYRLRPMIYSYWC